MASKPKVEIKSPELYAADPSLLTVILHEEDHTIGNSLKHMLCARKDVEFCGYNVPHPLEDKILIRLQTKEGVPAGPILLQALEDLTRVYSTVREKFTDKYASFKEKQSR